MPSPRSLQLCVVLLLTLSAACSKADHGASPAPQAQAAVLAGLPGATGGGASAVAAPSRKVIRNAELGIETPDPALAQQKVARLAEAAGGYIVSSDTSTRAAGEDDPGSVTVSLVVRVPVERFAASIDELHRLDGRVYHEKITGQDVTDQFVDLEARLRAKKALEEHFGEILRTAKSVADSLEVEKQLGEVRTDIERLEGQLRLLDNQASLSTITLTLQRTAPPAAEAGLPLGATIRTAWRDALSVGAGIIVGLIRALGVLAPIAVLIGLPVALIVSRLVRRSRRAPLRAG